MDKMQKQEIEQQVTQGLDEAVTVVEIVLEQLEKNPKAEELMANVISKYAGLFTNAMRTMHGDMVTYRVEQIDMLVESGAFTKQEAIQIVCGR